MGRSRLHRKSYAPSTTTPQYRALASRSTLRPEPESSHPNVYVHSFRLCAAAAYLSRMPVVCQWWARLSWSRPARTSHPAWLAHFCIVSRPAWCLSRPARRGVVSCAAWSPALHGIFSAGLTSACAQIALPQSDSGVTLDGVFTGQVRLSCTARRIQRTRAHFVYHTMCACACACACACVWLGVGGCGCVGACV